MNNRRKLIVALGAGAITTPLGLFAQQQGKVWRVGFLAASAPPAQILEVFRDSLREHGYVEGKNLAIEYRISGTNERLPEFAAELARLKVDLTVAWTSPAVLAAKQGSASIPIVFFGVSDPVGSALVASLGRPGGNVTGLSNVSTDLSGKILEMLVQMVPRISRFAVLRNGSNPSSALLLKENEAAARLLGLQLHEADVRAAADLDTAFANISKARAAGVVMLPDPLFLSERQRIADLALKHRLPAIGGGAAIVVAKAR